jgi:16S rRNA (cytosine967-C5)-methyltransferase
MVSELPGFAQGSWWVQDAAAALPVRLLGDVAGRLVVDLCAAPGGKAAQLAAAGAHVIAVDRAAGRMQRLRQNFRRLGLAVETVIADATAWHPPQAVDAVLVDAPCTATGTIRRHPDVAWIKQPDDVPVMAAVQRRLLDSALAMTRRGGRVVYCACSLQPEEGTAHRDTVAALTEPCDIEPISADEVAGLGALVTERGEIRTLPCHLGDLGGMDGFFVLRLQRR